jgi:hypothetical protein
MENTPTPAEEARRLYEEAETKTARAMEELVGRDAFGEILARVTENVLALVKMGNDTADLVVRNLRVAGRRDITGLARQLARTEDKLELVLQEVERLRDAVEQPSVNGAPPPARGTDGARRGTAAPRRRAEPES